MEVCNLKKNKKGSKNTNKNQVTKKSNKKFSWQKVVIYLIIGAFLLTGILSGAAGMGAL
jgi:cell division protein FtsL